jgi:hypothetical protein
MAQDDDALTKRFYPEKEMTRVGVQEARGGESFRAQDALGLWPLQHRER